MRHLKSTAVGCAGLLLALGGCAHGAMNTPTTAVSAGDWRAELEAVKAVEAKKSARRWILDRMRAGVAAMDAGEKQIALKHFSDAYDLMRQQGLNDDRTIAAYCLNEGVKIWKGEPFEQAMMLAYYGMLQAQYDSWDNCRAACDNALFSLRDLSGSETGNTTRANAQPTEARSRAYESAKARGATDSEALAEADAIGGGKSNGYVTVPSDFALGHLLFALSAQQLGRDAEASDHFAVVKRLRADIAADLACFEAKKYNTVLVVGYGLGPQKVAFGPDNALTRFDPRTYASSQALSVSVDGTTTQHHPMVDLNTMARDHRWRDLEEVRLAKSVAGNVSIFAGEVLLLDAASRDGRHRGDEALLGVAVLAVGAMMKATAHARLEYCDLFPQRMFVVPMNIGAQGASVDISLPGGGRVQTHIDPPSGPEAALRYVRLPGY